MSFSNGEMVGNYRILEQLGQGGMATVFKAYHAALDRYVALKVLHPALLEDKNFLIRFQREARVVARLEHPNIVPVHDFAEHEGRPYLVMKFIEGETLKARLQSGQLPFAEIPGIVAAVGEALSYAHRQGILHRDIKPSNVMIANDGHIYLADFGLARIAQAGESTLTSDMIVGTPQYISPEQAVGKKDLDEGTDIYSFGVMLYELVVGRVPFSADTPYAIIHDHIYSPLPLPSVVNPSVVPEMERMLLKALSKERSDRFKDVPEMVRAFKEAWEIEAASLQTAREQVSTPEAETILPAEPEPANLQTVEAKPEPEPPPEPVPTPARQEKKPRPRRRWLWIPVGMLCLAAVAVGAFFILSRMPDAPAIPISGTTQLLSKPTNTSRPPTKVPATPTASLPPGVLFQANFDDNQQPAHWKMEQGWRIKNGVLCGAGHFFTGSIESGWKDYAASFRLRVDQGYVHLNLRHTQVEVWKRYFVSFVPGEGLGLHKQIDQGFLGIQSQPEVGLETGKWYQVQLVAQGQRIVALVDGVIVLDYFDPEALPNGGLSFETLENSTACIDDLKISDLSGKAPFDVLYSQDFNSSSALQDWQLTDAGGKPNTAWELQEGALCGSGHNWAVLRKLTFGDFNTRFRFSIKSGSIHLNFRISEQEFGRYLFWLAPESTNINLSRNKGDENRLLISGRGRILPLQWYDLSVSMIEGRLQFWINGKRVIAEVDKEPLGKGYLGFESLDARNVCIDDLIVTLPSLVEPAE